LLCFSLCCLLFAVRCAAGALLFAALLFAGLFALVLVMAVGRRDC
jgi:hypothetical protein